MPSWSEQQREIEQFLNQQDAERSRRRKPHHLEPAAYCSADVVWAVTLCARHHGRPFVSADIAQQTVGALRHYRSAGNWLLYAYCLMPDHLHAVVRLAQRPGGETSDIRGVIARFKRYTTTQIAWKAGLPGPLWQRDFYDHGVRSSQELDAQCRYVLDNAVRKGLVQEWNEYPWCGIVDAWD